MCKCGKLVQLAFQLRLFGALVEPVLSYAGVGTLGVEDS
jgi:hypothetical protein